MNDVAEPSPSRWQAGLIVLACWLYVCCLTLADPDLWGHTLYGLRAIEQGVLTERTDPFSYTVPGGEWVNHEWLVELQYGRLWKDFGNTGLWWWRNLVVAVPFVVAWFAARSRGASVAGIVAAVVPASICLSQFTCFIRPQLVTYALLAITLAIVRRFVEGGANRSVWLLPPLLVLWTNLHGGFLAGLGVLLVALCELVRRSLFNGEEWHRAIRFGFVVLLATLGTVVTPYGVVLHRMLWFHLGTGQIVSEWQPVWATRQAPAYFVPFVLPLVALLGSRRWTWFDLAIVLVVAFQGALHLKHVALLCVTCMVLLPDPLSETVRRLFPRIHDQWAAPERGRLRWAGTLAMIAVIGLLQVQSLVPMWQNGMRPWDVAVSTRGYVPGVPIRAIRYMHRHRLEGNVVTDYGWAQFVIWHTHPESRIAFDGRYRTVYPAGIEREYVEFVTVDPDDGPEPLDLLDGHASEIVLLSKTRETTVAYMTSRDDWKQAYEDEQAVLFVREGFANVARETADSETAEPEWEVFPGRSRPETNPSGNTDVSSR